MIPLIASRPSAWSRSPARTVRSVSERHQLTIRVGCLLWCRPKRNRGAVRAGPKCVCLRLWQEVRAVSHMARRDNKVGEKADWPPLYSAGRIWLLRISLPQQLPVSRRYQSGLNGA